MKLQQLHKLTLGYMNKFYCNPHAIILADPCIINVFGSKVQVGGFGHVCTHGHEISDEDGLAMQEELSKIHAAAKLYLEDSGYTYAYLKLTRYGVEVLNLVEGYLEGEQND